ncbi:MAG: MFS transporter [Candidatus Sumerlaeia bacterium]|nr:MFS transporter [Candidatus Sumerlaeia bacterium]
MAGQTMPMEGSPSFEQKYPNRFRLFVGSCLALTATSVTFAVIGDIIGALKTEFILTNAQIGLIAAVSLWGFTLAMLLLGPIVDLVGMKKMVFAAFCSHLIGALVMIFATDYTMLVVGALILSFGNGTVEAACNPLVATVYPDRKTEKLNQFHVWFPGGVIIGGLLCYLFSQIGLGWQAKLCIILVPTILYGLTFFSQTFPETERVSSGVSYKEMWTALLRPFFFIFFICMAFTTALELGPNRWIPSILQAGGIPGILVLVWISGIMAVLRYFAGYFVGWASPTGLLILSSVISGVGLFWLSFAETGAVAFLAATVFAIGISYFFPTMVGVVSERVPKGGALAMCLVMGMGMLGSGFMGQVMGNIADRYVPDRLDENRVAMILETAMEEFTPIRVAGSPAPGQSEDDIDPEALQAAIDVAEPLNLSGEALAVKANTGSLPHPETANALRAIIRTGLELEVVGEAATVLDPADNYGGRLAFRYVSAIAVLLLIVFLLVSLNDRRRGGYKIEKLH